MAKRPIKGSSQPPTHENQCRDVYGFTIRPQHLQLYKQYSAIYKVRLLSFDSWFLSLPIFKTSCAFFFFLFLLQTRNGFFLCCFFSVLPYTRFFAYVFILFSRNIWAIRFFPCHIKGMLFSLFPYAMYGFSVAIYKVCFCFIICNVQFFLCISLATYTVCFFLLTIYMPCFLSSMCYTYAMYAYNMYVPHTIHAVFSLIRGMLWSIHTLSPPYQRYAFILQYAS